MGSKKHTFGHVWGHVHFVSFCSVVLMNASVQKGLPKLELKGIQYTLFSECLAHENYPNCLKSLGHRPRPWVILWPGVGISDPRSPVELGEINVHFFWRRVYLGKCEATSATMVSYAPIYVCLSCCPWITTTENLLRDYSQKPPD